MHCGNVDSSGSSVSSNHGCTGNSQKETGQLQALQKLKHKVTHEKQRALFFSKMKCHPNFPNFFHRRTRHVPRNHRCCLWEKCELPCTSCFLRVPHLLPCYDTQSTYLCACTMLPSMSQYIKLHNFKVFPILTTYSFVRI